MKIKILVWIGVLLSGLAHGQINYQPQTIKVTGIAEKLVEPNEVHLVVYLKEVNERNSQIPLVQARTEFMKICTAAGVAQEAIKLSNANSRLEKKLSLWRETRTSVIQEETYDIKFTDMNQLLLTIEALDKPFVETLHFGEQTHTEITTFKKEVKQDAAKAAIEKATYLAKASGREIGKIIYLEELEEVNAQELVNSYANQITYKKESYGGGAKVNFGFKPLALRYKVQVICELK